MTTTRARLTLGGRIKKRRVDLGMSVREAARRAGVNRKTWASWERDDSVPSDANYRLIDDFCEWEPGSTESVTTGRLPRLRRPATVTPLHPDVLPPDDEFVAEMRTIMSPGPVLEGLIAAYWAEKAGADAQRQERYRAFAREANG